MMGYAGEEWERIYMLALTRDLFDSPEAVTARVLQIARAMTRDSDVDKVRSFARAAIEEKTISVEDALKVIRDVAEVRVLD